MFKKILNRFFTNREKTPRKKKTRYSYYLFVEIHGGKKWYRVQVNTHGWFGLRSTPSTVEYSQDKTEANRWLNAERKAREWGLHD